MNSRRDVKDKARSEGGNEKKGKNILRSVVYYSKNPTFALPYFRA
jgi:hypothetical protein